MTDDPSMNAPPAQPGPALGYSEGEDGVITLRMTRDDWRCLLLYLGVTAAKPFFELDVKRFVNRLNAGRPREEWRPYFDPGPEDVRIVPQPDPPDPVKD